MNKTSLTSLTIAESLHGIKSRNFSACEVVNSYIDLIQENRHLNSYILETFEHAKAAAVITDHLIASGRKLRPLDGVQIGIKDVFCTKGIQTTAGSFTLSKFIPPYESTVTSRLWNAGAGMLGKLNMDEFSMGSTCLTSYFGPVKSPWKDYDGNENYVPGGSSGGSSSAVASGLVMASICSDTGGSARQPAAYTGVVGLRPTYGRCSRFGLIAFSSSLDQAGLITKDVRDASILLRVISGYDSRDSVSLDSPVQFFERVIDKSLDGLLIGLPKGLYTGKVNQDVATSIDKGIKILIDSGAKILEVFMPYLSYSLETYYVLTSAEAASNLARYDGVRYGHRSCDARNLYDLYSKTRTEGFGNEVKRRVLIGTLILSSEFYESYYLKAQKIRRLIINDFREAFKKVNVLLLPVTPTQSPKEDDLKDPMVVYSNDSMTVPSSLAGLPSISVPISLSSNGLPLGLQIIGPPLDEGIILNVALVLEKNSSFQKLYKLYSKFS